MRSCFFTQEKTTPRGGFKMSKNLTFRHMGLTTWAEGTLEAQYAIDDSSLTVRAEVGDGSDDRGQLQFIRFVTVRFQA
jgi:hypothetical protein